MTDSMITLNNGVALPTIGLGVLNSEGTETTSAVSTALQAGYRLIDTAAAYFNEREVGRGIRDSGVERGEIFVTTKLWMTDYGFDRTLRAFDTSLAKLGIVPRDLGDRLAAAVRLRNILVHDYLDVDHGRLFDELGWIDDAVTFAAVIDAWLTTDP